MRRILTILSISIGLSLGAAPLALAETNQRPVARPDTIKLNVGAEGFGAFVMRNDSDANGDALTISQVNNTSCVKVVVVEKTWLDLSVPTTCAPGSHTFTYQVKDGSLSSEPTTVTVPVSAVKPLTTHPNQKVTNLTVVCNDNAQAALFRFVRDGVKRERHVPAADCIDDVYNNVDQFVWTAVMKRDGAPAGSDIAKVIMLRPRGQLVEHSNGTFNPRLNNRDSNRTGTYDLVFKRGDRVIKTVIYKVGARRLVIAPAFAEREGVRAVLYARQLSGAKLALDVARG